MHCGTTGGVAQAVGVRHRLLFAILHLFFVFFFGGGEHLPEALLPPYCWGDLYI